MHANDDVTLGSSGPSCQAESQRIQTLEATLAALLVAQPRQEAASNTSIVINSGDAHGGGGSVELRWASDLLAALMWSFLAMALLLAFAFFVAAFWLRRYRLLSKSLKQQLAASKQELALASRAPDVCHKRVGTDLVLCDRSVQLDGLPPALPEGDAEAAPKLQLEATTIQASFHASIMEDDSALRASNAKLEAQFLELSEKHCTLHGRFETCSRDKLDLQTRISELEAALTRARRAGELASEERLLYLEVELREAKRSAATSEERKVALDLELSHTKRALVVAEERLPELELELAKWKRAAADAAAEAAASAEDTEARKQERASLQHQLQRQKELVEKLRKELHEQEISPPASAELFELRRKNTVLQNSLLQVTEDAREVAHDTSVAQGHVHHALAAAMQKLKAMEADLALAVQQRDSAEAKLAQLTQVAKQASEAPPPGWRARSVPPNSSLYDESSVSSARSSSAHGPREPAVRLPAPPQHLFHDSGLSETSKLIRSCHSADSRPRAGDGMAIPYEGVENDFARSADHALPLLKFQPDERVNSARGAMPGGSLEDRLRHIGQLARQSLERRQADSTSMPDGKLREAASGFASNALEGTPFRGAAAAG